MLVLFYSNIPSLLSYLILLNERTKRSAGSSANAAGQLLAALQRNSGERREQWAERESWSDAGGRWHRGGGAEEARELWVASYAVGLCGGQKLLLFALCVTENSDATLQ